MSSPYPILVTATQVLQHQPHLVHQFYSASSTLVRLDGNNRDTVTGLLTLEVPAAVAQQETAEETAPVEESSAEEKGEGEVEVESVVNTKLYFGNLPCNVDSAQLAAIIQDYGSRPNLVGE
ncbi:hypothetical protein F3Y22_tig00111504pilonHSYRG00048 [Hibiscus syriacus]|uniref:RRM domain-containing protein n=1 Tax=Hibiscus syriacus TaxID=106335 RepID=A0A6A2XQ25_HIBSY|nr:hypothetical protein F3Y22_tig00111504pilonHSYRG00048 [Hibiscus syriacus]